MDIRLIRVEDAARFLELRKALDHETRFMMLEPDERTTTPEEQRQAIEKLLADGHNAIFVADAGDRLAGYISLYRGAYRRNRHCGEIVIGIRQPFTGQGLGARLFEALIDWARREGLHRLELTVMRPNERAVRLYQKVGFAIEGVRRDSLCIDGAYVDEYSMSLLLD